MNHSADTYVLTSGVKLIGISGKAESGKDTVADFLIETYKNHYYEPFAYGLKDAAAAAFALPRDSFDDRSLKKAVVDSWGVSPRQIIQFVGTELFRNTICGLLPEIGQNFWVHRMYLRCEGILTPDDVGAYESGDTVVIPDVRFQNEYDFVKANNGIIINLTRPGIDGNIGIPNHSSESGIIVDNTYGGNYSCVNDGSISDLHRKIANIIVSATQY